MRGSGTQRCGPVRRRQLAKAGRNCRRLSDYSWACARGFFRHLTFGFRRAPRAARRPASRGWVARALELGPREGAAISQERDVQLLIDSNACTLHYIGPLRGLFFYECIKFLGRAARWLEAKSSKFFLKRWGH